MSGEEDTFDIDIYGDQAQQDEQQPEQEYADEGQGANGESYGYDGANDEIDFDESPTDEQQVAGTNQATNGEIQKPNPINTETSQSQSQPQQGTKRKHEDDDSTPSSTQYPQTTQPDSRPLDPGATPALKLNNLEWYITEEDVRAVCSRAGAEQELRDIMFNEYKQNGKCKGDAYLEFATAQAATAVKYEIDKANQSKPEGSAGSAAKKATFTAFFSPVGNPFRTGASAGAVKKDYVQSNPGGGRGAYNQNYNSRGNFRGSFNQNRGGYNNNNNMYNSRPNQQQQNWGMNGGGMQGYGANPMMGGGMGMSRGGMMNMARGGFAGMGNMGGMNMMGMQGMGRGGMMNMMGNMGNMGWNGGMQFPNAGGFQQGGAGGSPGPQQGNKRAKME